jgi:nucleotide-binding universal stress UspA family protein
MGSIVVGCDGSPSAAEALRWAADEGEARGWTVTALLAWDYLNQPAGATGEKFNPAFGDAEAREVLARTLQEALGDRATHVQPVVVCDLPARALLEAGAAADLLVVGARGLGSVRGALLGSVSQQCLHHSKVPVAVIRGGLAPEATGIVVAIDGSEGSQRALDWALDEARAQRCTITVVHAWHPSPSAAWAVPAAWPDMSGMQADADELIDRALQRADTSDIPPDMIQRHAVFGTVVDAVLDESRDARLLVVGSRGRGGFAGLLLGSASQHLAHHATCPIVVVPPPRS